MPLRSGSTKPPRLKNGITWGSSLNCGEVNQVTTLAGRTP